MLEDIQPHDFMNRRYLMRRRRLQGGASLPVPQPVSHVKVRQQTFLYSVGNTAFDPVLLLAAKFLV